MRALLGIGALLLSPILGSAAAFGSPGTAGADFAKILVAPRPSAMGGAGSALGLGLSGFDLNPASLAGQPGWQAEAAHVTWLEGIALDRVALGWGQPGGVSLGFSYMQLGTADMTGIDANGIELGAFRQQDRSVALAAAWALGRADAGLALRGLQRELAGLSQSGVQGDVGARLRLGKGWALGLAAQHLGSLSALEREADAAPMTLRGGLAWDRPLNDSVQASIALDGVQSIDSAVQARAGLELRFQRMLALRIGSQFSEAFDSRQAFTAGAGFAWQGLGIDYAWAPFGILGNTHRAGLSYSPSPRRAAKAAPARAGWLQARREADGVVLSWDGASAPRWAVYLKRGAQEGLTRVAETSGGQARVRLRNVGVGAEVLFAVAPIDPVLGEGARSHQLSLAPGHSELRVAAPPLAPQRLRVQRDKDGAKLLWEAPEGAPAGLQYQAYVSNRHDGGFQPLGGLSALTERSIDLSSLKRRAFFSVRARVPEAGALWSDWAPTVSVQP